MSNTRPAQAWLATLLTGLAWGLAPPDGVGAAFVLVGAAVAPWSLRGRPIGDLGRGLVVGALWYGLQLWWLPGAWYAFAGGPATLVHPAVIGLQAVGPGIVWFTTALAVRLGAPAPVAWVGAWIGLTPLLGTLAPLPGGLALHLAGAPLLAWPAAFGGRELLHGVVAAWGVTTGVRPRVAAVGLMLWAGLGLGYNLLPDQGEVVQVGLIQPDVHADETRRPGRNEARITRLHTLIARAADAGAAWIATPEGAWPVPLDEPDLGAAWRGLPPIALGATWEGAPGANAMLALEDGRVRARFDKQLLVPLAETTWMGLGRARFRAGRGPRLLRIGATQVAPLLCYEDLLPDALRAVARDGGSVVVAAANDGWLTAPGAALHLAASRLAALETGRWVVRPTLDGDSAVLDARGGLRARLPPGDDGSLVVVAVRRYTPAFAGAQVGPWLSLTTLLVLGVVVVRAHRRAAAVRSERVGRAA